MPFTGCSPGDFEAHSAIMLGCNELLPYHPQVLVDFVAALVDRITIVGIVDSEEQRKQLVTLLCDWGLPAHLLHFVSLPVKGMWVRDYGPGFARREDNSVVILDAEYLETDRPEDDNAPSDVAALLRLPVVHVPLIVEGGNMLMNGEGLLLTTQSVVARNAARGHTEKSVHELLKTNYGASEMVMLQPLTAEPTGHVDMFATLVSPDTVVVGEYDPRMDPVNADILNHNAAVLSQVRTRRGLLRVVRVPMPPNRGSVWRTYTNVVYANGMLLVPTYGSVDPVGQAKAMSIYESLLPGWRVVGIDSTSLIRQRGALRCVCIKIPLLDELFPAPEAENRHRLRKDTLISAGAE